jgi:hypothetical protein
MTLLNWIGMGMILAPLPVALAVVFLNAHPHERKAMAVVIGFIAYIVVACALVVQ